MVHHATDVNIELLRERLVGWLGFNGFFILKEREQ